MLVQEYSSLPYGQFQLLPYGRVNFSPEDCNKLGSVSELFNPCFILIRWRNVIVLIQLFQMFVYEPSFPFEARIFQSLIVHIDFFNR
jgi:hypothetical protein